MGNSNESSMSKGYQKMGELNLKIAEEGMEVDELSEYEKFLDEDNSEYMAAFRNIK